MLILIGQSGPEPLQSMNQKMCVFLFKIFSRKSLPKGNMDLFCMKTIQI